MAKPKRYQKSNSILKLFMVLLVPMIGIVGLVYLISRGDLEFLSRAEIKDGWKRHTIDSQGSGADGVKLIDVNGDGYKDITTGWEQSDDTKLYINPGPDAVTLKWPNVTVGKSPSAEDAIAFDINGDKFTDVLSFTEGSSKKIFVYLASGKNYLNTTNWQKQTFKPAENLMQWMFATTAQIDGKNGIDLIAGGKNANAKVGWFESPADPSKLDQWKWHPMSDAGWIMSIVQSDMDGDNDIDIVVSDRHNPKLPSVRWLKNPGPASVNSKWESVKISNTSSQVRFLALGDLDKDGLVDVVTADKGKVIFSRRLSADGTSWQEYPISFPQNTGYGKGISIVDVNKDGQNDLVLTFVHAEGEKISAVWMSYTGNPMTGTWKSTIIAGTDGIKYDVVEMNDLDGDGDLDMITTEENEGTGSKGLGVIWYENPTTP